MMNSIGLKTLVGQEIQKFLRVAVQTLVSPWINAILYIFIFGFVIGQRIDLIASVSYIEFVLPGVLMLNLISSAFQHTAFSLYFKRFARHIEELLTAPLSNAEILIGHTLGGVTRALVVGIGVYIIALLFGAAQIVHPLWFLFYSISVAIIFSLLGLLVGLWADNFEQLSILGTFVITPLTFLGGMFNSVTMLPEKMQLIAYFNPFFYFVDGLRYSMTGIQESNQLIGIAIIVGLILFLGGFLWHLFNIGWRLRN